MSRFTGAQHAGATRELRQRRRLQAATRTALTRPERRRAARRDRTDTTEGN
jgi:hypothetical protein